MPILSWILRKLYVSQHCFLIKDVFRLPAPLVRWFALSQLQRLNNLPGNNDCWIPKSNFRVASAADDMQNSDIRSQPQLHSHDDGRDAKGPAADAGSVHLESTCWGLRLPATYRHDSKRGKDYNHPYESTIANNSPANNCNSSNFNLFHIISVKQLNSGSNVHNRST